MERLCCSDRGEKVSKRESLCAERLKTTAVHHQSIHFSAWASDICLFDRDHPGWKGWFPHKVTDLNRFELNWEVWWIVSGAINAFKAKNCIWKHVCLWVCLYVSVYVCVRGGGGVFLTSIRVGAYSSLSYPAVVQSGDLADPCISAHLSLQAVIVM